MGDDSPRRYAGCDAHTTALYYLSYAFGGPGFSVPMGLLMAGVCIPAAFRKLLPKWVVAFGLLLAHVCTFGL